MIRWLKFGGALLVVIAFVYWLKNHSGYFPYSHNPMQYMPNMHRTNAIKTQRNAPFFEDNSGARTPPVGAVSRDLEYYPFTKETRAEDTPAKPNELPVNLENIEQGAHIYNSYCIVCHGPKGLGMGYVVPPYPKVPTLHSDRVRALADSQLFHIITVGQNTMGAYGPQIRIEDRWKLVQYLRALQRAENPSKEDLDAFKKVGERGQP